MTTERIRELLDRGAPWEACDAFREAAAAAPGVDPALLYWGALAHARSGATHEAHALLDRAQPLAEAARATRLLTEILSLRGRLAKDAVHRALRQRVKDAGDRELLQPAVTALVARARDAYLAAWRIGNAAFPGINVATLTLILGDREGAARFARDVIASLPSEPTATWDLATLGEACLLLGDVDGATASYAAAFRAGAGNAGIVASMRRQLALIERVLPAAAQILGALPSPSVVAFAGHMVDAPGRLPSRFPPELVPAVAAALRDRVASLRNPIVYTSAACGADLLLIDAAIEAGAEVTVVLPFARADFVRVSVAPGGDEWARRFNRAVASAHRVVMATEEPYLGDDVLFENAAKLVEGFAALRAEQLQTRPLLLCVTDSSEATAPLAIGGTRSTLARWQSAGRDAEVIDLAALRGVATRGAPPPIVTGAVASGALAGGAAASMAVEGERTMKTMLFGDLAGYSRLGDSVIPRFQRTFLDIAATLIDAAGPRVLEAKTWGDGLYIVFDDVRAGADLALRVVDRVGEADWSGAGAVGTPRVRVSLHTGPVFRCFDRVMGRDGYFGAHVTRAARIEPITPPGVVYASEAFAATLASEDNGEFALEYVGTLALAKGYGDSRIYRVEQG